MASRVVEPDMRKTNESELWPAPPFTCPSSEISNTLKKNTTNLQIEPPKVKKKTPWTIALCHRTAEDEGEGNSPHLFQWTRLSLEATAPLQNPTLFLVPVRSVCSLSTTERTSFLRFCASLPCFADWNSGNYICAKSDFGDLDVMFCFRA